MRRSFCCNLLESFPCQFGIHANYAAREKFRKSEGILTADLRVQEAAIMERRQTYKATRTLSTLIGAPAGLCQWEERPCEDPETNEYWSWGHPRTIPEARFASNEIEPVVVESLRYQTQRLATSLSVGSWKSG